MINQFFGILKVIGKKNTFKSLQIILILLTIVILELLNFGLIIPILTLLFDSNNAENLKFFNDLNNLAGLDEINILTLGLIFLFIIILKILFLLYFEYKSELYSREILIDISLKAYSYFLFSPWQEVSSKEHSYILRNIISDTKDFVTQGVIKYIQIIKNTLILFFIVGYLFFINFKITLIILLSFSFLTIFFLLVIKKKLLDLSETSAHLSKFRLKNISESIISLRDIKLSGNPYYFLKLFQENEKKITSVSISNTILSKVPKYLLEILIVIAILFTIFYLESNNFDLINLIPIIGLYSFAILRLIPIFVAYNQDIQATRVVKFQIDEVIKNASKFSKIFHNNQISIKNIKNGDLSLDEEILIEIKDLDFSYNNKQIFKNLNLILKKNSTIYLGGLNGSGKSTFVDLLSGMLLPNKGDIFINGKNLSDIKNIWLRNLGYVSQTNFLINSSIKDNIVFGRDNINDNKLNKVIKLVGLEDFLNNFSDGVLTNVGNLGGTLSGGQKQKIVIARALVNDPKIIILDESTNALDMEGQRKFLEIINKIKKNKLIIFIAHSKIIENFCDIRFKIENKLIKSLNEKK